MNTTKGTQTATKPGRNREQHAAVIGIRASNAATSHDSRPNRQRTRATAKATARKDWS